MGPRFRQIPGQVCGNGTENSCFGMSMKTDSTKNRKTSQGKARFTSKKFRGLSRVALGFESLACLAHLAIEWRRALDRSRTAVRWQRRGDRRARRPRRPPVRGLVYHLDRFDEL